MILESKVVQNHNDFWKWSVGQKVGFSSCRIVSERFPSDHRNDHDSERLGDHVQIFVARPYKEL